MQGNERNWTIIDCKMVIDGNGEVFVVFNNQEAASVLAKLVEGAFLVSTYGHLNAVSVGECK